MAITASEQYLIELINRARLDPQAEAARYGLALNAGLQGVVITDSPLDPLSPDTELETAAQAHSEWMLAADVFDHTGQNGSSPGARISDAGYEFTGTWAWRENLAWTGSTATVNTVAAIEEHHEGLYRSAGHRVNTFADNIKEIGVAQVMGQFTHQGTAYNSSMLTLNFAATGRDVYVTGVTYRDNDDDLFYDIGEGYGGVTIRADDTSQTTASAGGYGIGVSADASLDVTVAQGSTMLARLRVDAANGNVKVDVVTDSSGDQFLALSSSATLVTGIPDAMLLGAADTDLNGSGVANVLTGNGGDNALRGYGGDDILSGGAGADQLFGGNGDDVLQGGAGRDASWGGLETTRSSENADYLMGEAGNDRLVGQSGFDVLSGGIGDDVLTGGGGRDTFVFTSGRDTVTDFADNVDTIEINSSTLGIDMTADEIIAMGRVVGGDAVFDFGGGNILTLTGETDIGMLLNDLSII